MSEQYLDIVKPYVSNVSKLRENRIMLESDVSKFKELMKKIKSTYSAYLTSLVAVDVPEEKSFELKYNMWVIDLEKMFTIKIKIPREKPTVPSVTDIFPGAMPFEQEVYDLLGIIFEGNAHLREHFFKPLDVKGYPLRKDWKGE